MDEPRRRPGGGEITGLLVILALAGVLRFVGLGWGLRHEPHYDERVFLENATVMVAQRDLDHRFYEYPALFFYLLYPVLLARGPESPVPPSTYLVARALVASFSLLAVAAAWWVGRRLVGPRGGLLAALLLAVSYDSVVTAHAVRLDAMLAFFVLASLALLDRPGARGDVLAGAALGLTTAVKFTGVLLAPSVALARLAAGRRAGVLVAAAVSAVLFFVLTPYALVHAGRYTEGVSQQWSYHYQGGVAARVLQHLGYYASITSRSLGLVGALAALAALALVRRHWRAWGPVALHPLVLLLPLVAADERYARLYVSAFGPLALLAAWSFDRAISWRPVVGWVLVAAAVLPPLRTSVGYLRTVSQPSAWDRVLDAVLAEVPARSRVLLYENRLGLDRRRYEVVAATGDAAVDRRLAESVDAIIAPPGARATAGLVPRLVAVQADHPEMPERFHMYVPDPRERPPTRLLAAELAASHSADQLRNLADGVMDTWWTTPAGGEPRWLELRFAAPERVVRIDLLLGARPGRHGRGLRVRADAGDGELRPVEVVDGTATFAGDGPRRQVLLLEGTAVKRLRIEEPDPGRHRWGAAEIQVQGLAP